MNKRNKALQKRVAVKKIIQLKKINQQKKASLFSKTKKSTQIIYVYHLFFYILFFYIHNEAFIFFINKSKIYKNFLLFIVLM